MLNQFEKKNEFKNSIDPTVYVWINETREWEIKNSSCLFYLILYSNNKYFL